MGTKIESKFCPSPKIFFSTLALDYCYFLRIHSPYVLSGLIRNHEQVVLY